MKPLCPTRSSPRFTRLLTIVLLPGLVLLVLAVGALLVSCDGGVPPQYGIEVDSSTLPVSGSSVTPGATGGVDAASLPVQPATFPPPGTPPPSAEPSSVAAGIPTPADPSSPHATSLGSSPTKLLTEPPTGSGAASPKTSRPTRVPIYWGAYIDGSTYDARWGDAPWDERSITAFEKNAGKAVSIIQFGQAWQANNGSMNAFDPVPYTLTREHGAIPLINWNPWQSCCGVKQPAWRLANIINGRYDDYITQWATAARNWGHPFFLRIMDEMNGNWYPWSEGVNGNQSGQFVQAWRHIHDIFTSVGATNVIWVWNPNTEYHRSLPLERLYPGDAYVDWVGMTGFNFGPTARGDVWLSFATLFGPLYDHLGRVAPSKPVMVCEMASTEKGGSKSDWITDALVTELPAHFTRVRAFVWFNWTAEGHDWYIESSPSAQAAFAKAIASPYFVSNILGDLDAAP